MTVSIDAFSPLMNIDAHAWMRSLRLEYHRVSQLRGLKVGEQLWVAYFSGPDAAGGSSGHCEAYFERVLGGLRFSAVWTIDWLQNPSRAHVMTNGVFRLLPGNRIAFKTAQDCGAARSFQLVCRYAQFIDRHAASFGVQRRTLERPHHSLWRGVTVSREGLTSRRVPGPQPQGLSAIVRSAFTLAILDERNIANGYAEIVVP